MILRNHAAPLRRRPERDARRLHELLQLCRRVRPDDPAARHHDRPLRLGQQLDRLLHLVRIRARARFRQPRLREPDRLVVAALIERVARQIQVGRPRLCALRLAVGQIEKLRHPRRVRHPARPARDRRRHRQLVVLLEIVALERGKRRRAAQRHHRHAVQVGVRHPRQQIGRGRPRGRHADPRQTLDPRVAVRRHRRALLVTAVDRADAVFGAVARRFNDRPPHDVEEILNPLLHHLASKQFRAHLFRHRLFLPCGIDVRDLPAIRP